MDASSLLPDKGACRSGIRPRRGVKRQPVASPPPPDSHRSRIGRRHPRHSGVIWVSVRACRAISAPPKRRSLMLQELITTAKSP